MLTHRGFAFGNRIFAYPFHSTGCKSQQLPIWKGPVKALGGLGKIDGGEFTV